MGKGCKSGVWAAAVCLQVCVHRLTLLLLCSPRGIQLATTLVLINPCSCNSLQADSTSVLLHVLTACGMLQTDLDPLQQLVKEEAKRKRKLEQLQQQQAAAGEAVSSSDAASATVVAIEEAARPAARGYSADDERRWRKASNVIDSVLSQ